MTRVVLRSVSWTLKRLALLLVLIVVGVITWVHGLLNMVVFACLVALVALPMLRAVSRHEQRALQHRRQALEIEMLEMQVQRERARQNRIPVSPDGQWWWDGGRWRPFGWWHENEASPAPPRPARLVEKALHRFPKW